jgi:hypothetical protein
LSDRIPKEVAVNADSVRRLGCASALWWLAAALAGCGAETATTAATGAVVKKQELEQARKTQERSQQKVEQALDPVQQRAQEGY